MEQVTLLQSKLVEARQQVRDIAGRINVVEERIDIVQRQLDHANIWRQLDETAIAAVRNRDQEQTVDRLWQELSRLGQKEDRLRQEKLIAAQVELSLHEALLQVPPGGFKGSGQDIEAGEETQKCTDDATGRQYSMTVRLMPPLLMACFLVSLFAWFGVDVQKKTAGLSTTQKVASIGSASFTIMTIVALFVRAAMCTGEWQWMLQTCYTVTGCRWFQPSAFPQQSSVKDRLPVMGNAPSLPMEASVTIGVDLDACDKAGIGTASPPTSPSSMDSSTFEEWKKK